MVAPTRLTEWGVVKSDPGYIFNIKSKWVADYLDVGDEKKIGIHKFWSSCFIFNDILFGLI